MSLAPQIAIVGSVKTDPAAPAAAEAIGRELAKAGFRIMVYSSSPDFLEGSVVRGYVASRGGAKSSIQVCYPLHGQKPAFGEQQTNRELFDFRPDTRSDWEMSFYQSLGDVDGILLLGGGESTMIAGQVAMGHGIAILAIAAFGGQATKVWEALRPGRDLPTADEISLMARPEWEDGCAAECVKALTDQIARKAEIERQKRVEERHREVSTTRRAGVAALLFVLSFACVFIGWAWNLDQRVALLVLFIGPLLAGVSGATIRLVFDMRLGNAPLTNESAVTTGALGLIAGGAAGLLFIIAQVTTATSVGVPGGAIVSTEQSSKLVAFGVLVGFTAGLTLDAVFRKLIASEVVGINVFDLKKRP